MSAPDNGDPYRILRDASARAEMALGNLLDDRPTLLLDDSADVIRAEVAALKAARALAESRAKLAAPTPEMGGTTLDLSAGDDARKLRALLQVAAMALGANAGPLRCDGVEVTHHDARAFRKRINAGVVRNCERRTGGAA